MRIHTCAHARTHAHTHARTHAHALVQLAKYKDDTSKENAEQTQGILDELMDLQEVGRGCV